MDKKEARQSLIAEIKKYWLYQWRYARLVCIEKLSVFFSGVAVAGTVAALALVALFYLAAAFQSYLSKSIGVPLSYVVLSAVFFVFIAIVLVFKRALIVNPISRFISKLFIDEAEETNGNGK